MQTIQQEPIALVGIGCRFPQAENPQAFWELLCAGQDAIREVPADRWNSEQLYSQDPLARGKAISRWGGFLDHIDLFDNHAFRLLPKEVRQMDPQHRLLLEVTWEALEDAGIPVVCLEGSRTGVFIGSSWSDFLQLQLRNWSQIDGYSVMGNARSFAANRLSYQFNLTGPSLSLDSGCSSSLTALYLACQSLWTGEANLAIAGGVSLLIAPETMVMVSQTGVLSPDGRCKTLDARADGFVRGEGAGIVILKPLADVKPSERVYAVIRGLAVNHNGFNDWIIASSQEAQEALLQDAYRKAGVSPHQVDYVELHGTGFQRGDALEVNTLGSVVGTHPERDSPCLIGSVKTNIGHLEAASGMASLIKVALALHHRCIPPTLNLQTENPTIPFPALHLAAAQSLAPWPTKKDTPLAGITALGLSGANSHAVLSAAPHVGREESTEQAGQAGPRLLPLSARGDAALWAYAAKLRDFLLTQTSGASSAAWRDICYTASICRTHHESRLAVVASTPQEASDAPTHALQQRQKAVESARTASSSQGQKLLFAFTSTQPEAVAINSLPLLAQDVFRTCAEESEQVFRQVLARSFVPETRTTILLSEKINGAKAHFIWQLSLAALWKSWGILPEMVLGEGLGKLAAACTTGSISLEDAFHILLCSAGYLPRADNSLVLQELPCLSPDHPTGLVIDSPREIGQPELLTQERPGHLRAFSLSQFEAFLRETSGVFLTIGPSSPSIKAVGSCVEGEQDRTLLLPALSPDRQVEDDLLEALGTLYTLGYTVNWPAFYTTETYRCVTLPTYAWQRSRFWPAWLTLEEISVAPEDRLRGIQEPDAGETSSEKEPSERTLLETLVNLWAGVLELEHVEPHESFFALGGHSLLAMQLLARIDATLHIGVSLSQLFQYPTPATFCSLLAEMEAFQEATGSSSEVSAVPVLVPDPVQRFQPFPLTDMQAAYWIGREASFEIGNVGNHGYLEVEAVDLDVVRVERAFTRLVERHEMLRAILLPDGRQQVLERTPPVVVPVIDLRHLVGEEQERAVQQVRQHLDHQLVPLDRWPAFALVATLLDEHRLHLHLSIEVLFVDAWSMNVLIQEFLQLYQHPEAVLPPIHLSFRDYVLTEQAWHGSAAYQRAQAYWQDRLPSLPAAPALPLAREVRSLTSPRFVHREARLAAPTWQRLKAHAARLGLTSSAVLLTAYAEILGTWSTSQQFSVNLSTFNRQPWHPEVDRLVGDFTSLLLLAVDHRVADSFEERARCLQAQLWRDLDHSQYSGVQVLRELARAQGEVGRAIMPVVFTSLLIQDTASAYPIPWERVVSSVSQTPQVWLDHQVLEVGGELIFHWQAVDALFPAGLIQSMFDAYTRLLERLANQEASWQQVPVVTLLESHVQQVAASNATEVAVSPRVLPALFLEQVSLRPTQVAVITPTVSLTYQQLCQHASHLAWRLRELGARPRQLVAIVMHKGWEQVVAALGVLLSGAAYVPIEASTPQPRLEYLLAHGEVELVVTQAEVDATVCWPATVRRVCVDSVVPEATLMGEQDLLQGPEDLAYVIYTSGSTGVPKGVMIDHRGAVNTIVDINRRFQVGSQDRVLALSSLSFDLSVYDIFGLLAAGGSVVLVEQAELRSPAAWVEALERWEVTLWNTVPALLQLLVEYLEVQQRRGVGQRLRLGLLSGDWIPLSLPERAREQFSRLELVSLGGATEASIWSILYPIGGVEPGWKSIPYGRAMSNQQWYVLNEAQEICPVWVPGSLYIGGVGLAQGYWRDEEKTRARFRSHPRSGVRLYETGDMGRYLPDGTIEFLGRQDLQVKVAGYRIELEEIETVLARHPEVQEVLVTVVSNGQRENRLVAGVVARVGAGVTGEGLRAYLQEQVPGYLVPSVFVVLAALPLTANGKVDRAAFRVQMQEQARGEGARGVAGESTPRLAINPETVRRVRAMVSGTLHLEQIGPEENLLELGMTSLDIFRIANQIEKQFQIHFDARQLFQATSIEAVAGYVDQLILIKKVSSDEANHPQIPADREDVSPDSALIVDPQKREQFKLAQHNIRRANLYGKQTRLMLSDLGEPILQKYIERRSRRAFAQHAIPFKDLSTFLECLRQISLAGKPKYQWGSAGGLYPVQVYLYSKAERIEGIEHALYYYNPIHHHLDLLAPRAQIAPHVFGLVNYQLFERAAFALFFVGQLQAIEPLYGELSRDFCLLEAGLMTQVLEENAFKNRIALCQIGGIAFEQIQQLFSLDKGAFYLHCLVGGALNEAEEDTSVSELTRQDEWVEEEI